MILLRSLEEPDEEVLPVDEFPPEACNTLYLTNLPPDITKREVSHILRPFEGFQVSSRAVPRLLVWYAPGSHCLNFFLCDDCIMGGGPFGCL